MANLMELATGLIAQGYSEEEALEVLKKAKAPDAIRPLTQDEYDIYVGALARAAQLMPSYRDALALIRPFKDHTTPTIYTDKNSRVGIGDPFFRPDKTARARAAELLHEAMHVMNHHFTRQADVALSSNNSNIARDFEINCLLDKMRDSHNLRILDLEGFILPGDLPWRFNPDLSMEQYSVLIKEGGFDNGEDTMGGENGEPSTSPSSSSPSQAPPSGDGSPSEGEPSDNSGEKSESDSSSSSSESLESIVQNASEAADGSSGETQGKCDASSPEREAKADAAGIDKASASEQTVARTNTAARIKEEVDAARARGDKGRLQALQMIQAQMQPAKVNWRAVLRKAVAQSRDKISLGRTDYSYRKVSKRLNYGDIIFPGMVQYNPSVMMAIDTSGSMTEKDFTKLLSELEFIVKNAIRGKDNFKAFCVDAKADRPQSVAKVKDLNLKGGGGTAMEVAIKAVELIPRREQPDLLIIATDGGTNWSELRDEIKKKKGRYGVIVLVTEEREVAGGQKTLQGFADVIDISEGD